MAERQIAEGPFMLDWYRDLGTAERRTFWACFGGWALDALDVQIYSFAIPALIALWHITTAQAGLLATSALPNAIAEIAVNSSEWIPSTARIPSTIPAARPGRARKVPRRRIQRSPPLRRRAERSAVRIPTTMSRLESSEPLRR